MATNKAEKIEVENVNHPGHVKTVDSDMYEAVKRAYLKILPKTLPGLTLAEIQERLAIPPSPSRTSTSTGRGAASTPPRTSIRG